MKKLLVLVLVFAMVSTANAVLSLKIVDNYALNPIPANLGKFGIESTTDYTLAPDDNLYFCAITAGPTYPYGGTVLPAAPANTAIHYPSDIASIVILPAGWNGMGGEIAVVAVGPVHVDAGTYIDGITSNVGNTVWLHIITPEGELGAIVETVTLVPEPMTLALLGLGGLFLRRRK